MRHLLILFVLATLCVSFPCSTINADPQQGVKFYEVDPFGDQEGFSLFNYGASSFSLKGYSVSDGEGKITFTEYLLIHPNSRMTVVKEIGGKWFSDRDNTYQIGSNGIVKTGNFILANTGDDLYLWKGDLLIDTVCYGTKPTDQGWFGEPVRISSNKYILRVGQTDTDSALDWITTKPGLTNYSFDNIPQFDALVHPFSFPESAGISILKEINDAKEEILISMYLLTSVDLVSIICSKLINERISVKILLEGNVLGQDITSELILMRSIIDAGGEVFLINDNIPGNPERYSYFHNKYAIIDNIKVIVTSENWTDGNLSDNCSNRGWGVVIESMEFADYVKGVFMNDIDGSYDDVRSLTDVYPDLKPYSLPLIVPDISYEESTFYNSTVKPILSPDNSYAAMEHLIINSEQRIFSQQMDIGSSYRNMELPSPLALMANSAKNGVDVRLILDSSFDEETSIALIELINNTSSIKSIAKNGGEGYSLIHNKGMIVDGLVWIGSVNWTENSFTNNREIAVIVDSIEVSDFFTELYETDWGINEHTVSEEGLIIEHQEFNLNGEIVMIFRISGPEGKEYLWDLFGTDEWRISGTNVLVCRSLPAGEYVMRATLKDTTHCAEYDYSVNEMEQVNEMPYLSILTSISLMSAGTFFALRKGRHNNRARHITDNDDPTNGFLRRGPGI